MDGKTLLAYITGTVAQELLLRNEYLVTENRILRHQVKGRRQFSDGERKTLAAIGQKPGKQALEEVANIVKPDIMSGITRVRTTCCSCLRSAKTQSVKARCSVANGSGGSCDTCARSRMSFLTIRDNLLVEGNDQRRANTSRG